MYQQYSSPFTLSLPVFLQEAMETNQQLADQLAQLDQELQSHQVHKGGPPGGCRGGSYVEGSCEKWVQYTGMRVSRDLCAGVSGRHTFACHQHDGEGRGRTGALEIRRYSPTQLRAAAPVGST